MDYLCISLIHFLFYLIFIILFCMYELIRYSYYFITDQERPESIVCKIGKYVDNNLLDLYGSYTSAVVLFVIILLVSSLVIWPVVDLFVIWISTVASLRYWYKNRDV